MAKKEKPLTLLQKLERGAQSRKLDRFSSQSVTWYKDKVKTMGGQNTRDTLIKNQTERGFGLSRTPGIGFMYSFVYDAKHKATLPYWDAFPLIIMVGPAEGGFYGLNVHYLSPKMRALFFDKLLAYTNNKRFDKKTKFAISYSMLKGAAKLSIFKPMFKHYLHSHVKSKIVKIPSEEWEAALYLPTADFKGAVNSKVWSDSGKSR